MGRDLVWIGLLVLTLVLGVVRNSEIESTTAELRTANAELKAELRLAHEATRDCMRDFRAAQKGEASTMVALPPPPPPPPPGRGNKGPSLRPRGGEQVLGPRKWPHRLPVKWPDGVVRYSVSGERCVLPFRYNGRTYSDCASLTLPGAGDSDGAGAGDVAAQWCPISGSDGVDGKVVEATTSQLRQCQANLNRQALIHNTIHGVWARIGRSAIGGVGVIAVRDIPRGQDPFPMPDGQSCGIGEYISVSPKEVKEALPGVKEMMNDFFAIETDGRQLMPVPGLNAMTTSYYLNHADARKGKVNMQPRECNCPVMCFYAVKDIKKGEELLFDYVNAFGEDALEQGTFDKIGRRRTRRMQETPLAQEARGSRSNGTLVVAGNESAPK